MTKQTSTTGDVQKDCFGDDSDLEADGDATSFWEQFNMTDGTTGAVHKLHALWELQGCDGAMSNSMLMPYEVAQWNSIKSHMEEQYQKAFEAAAAEIWALDGASRWVDFWKEDLAKKTGPHFVGVLESLKPVQTGQLDDPSED